eukprot:6329418-Prymnesium_polylepis.1
MADDTDEPHEDETRRPHARVLGSVLKTQDPGSWAASRPRTPPPFARRRSWRASTDTKITSVS